MHWIFYKREIIQMARVNYSSTFLESIFHREFLNVYSMVTDMISECLFISDVNFDYT